MHAHFRHFKLAYEALTDCISAAREKRDECCLQYAMMWTLIILQQFDQSYSSESSTVNCKSSSFCGRSVQNDLHMIENLVTLIISNEHVMPYIAAMAHLLMQRFYYLRTVYPSISVVNNGDQGVLNYRYMPSTRTPLATKPIFLAAQHQMNDILMKAYNLNSAVLNACGASNLASLISLMILKIDLSDSVDQDRVAYVNDNIAIALRNVAMFQWVVKGNYQFALELLKHFKKYYFRHNSQLRCIIEQVLAEIIFEHHLHKGEWQIAQKCINLVKCINLNQSLLMLAELKQHQNEPIIALECIDTILVPFTSAQTNKPLVFSTKSQSGVSSNNSPLMKTSFLRSASMNNLAAEENCVIVGDLSSSSNSTNLSGVLKHKKVRFSDASSINYFHSTLNNTRSFPGDNQSNSAFRENSSSNLNDEEDETSTTDLDPYFSLSCQLLKSTVLGDLSGLLNCVVKAKAQGFMQLECRALLQISHLQQTLFSQFVESQSTINSIMVRLLANGALRDIGFAFYLTAANHFNLHRLSNGSSQSLFQVPLVSKYNNIPTWNCLQTSAWANRRSLVIWEQLDDQINLLKSLQLATLIEHECQNFVARNHYARKAKLVRSELLKR